jgi:hypothetical protein
MNQRMTVVLARKNIVHKPTFQCSNGKATPFHFYHTSSSETATTTRTTKASQEGKSKKRLK